MFYLFKKIKVYIKYYKKIKRYEEEINKNYNIYIDWIGRLYTIIITDKDYDDLDDVQNDIKFRNFFLEFYKGFLMERKFFEIVPILLDKKDKRTYLIVFGHENINPKKIINNFILFILLLITSIITLFII